MMYTLGRRMLEKTQIASAVLLCAIVALTVFAVGASPKPVLLGSFAQYLLSAILTTYLLLLVYSSRTIIDLIASFLLGKKEGQRRGKSWMIMIGYVIGTILLILILRSGALTNLVGIAETFVGLTSTLKAAHGFRAPAISAPSRYIINYLFVTFAAIILVSFGLFIEGIHTAYRWVRDDNVPLTSDKVKLETLRVIQRTIRDLRLTDDRRATILNCYREMCRVLSLHGFQTEFHETAREFSKAVSEKLGLGSDSVNYLTLLFEEARYSDHRIDDGKCVQALNQLESLERSLSSNSRS